jgi:pSer/pThr/pTyr-binding forkhead associated (FHA) protein
VQQEKDPDDSEEMIAPALVFPEQFAATVKSEGAAEAPATRLLVLLDPEQPVKYPLFKEVMTIGRADAADIQIDNGFLSRLHARIVSTPEGVTIEDYESKNGIRVNTKLTQRQALRHGDTIDLGRLRFRFIDAASDDES